MGKRNAAKPIEDQEQYFLQRVSRSFSLTIPQLPPELRKPIANAYLLCRIADTIEDETSLSLDQKRIFFHEFIDVVNGKAPAQQFAERLCPLISGKAVPGEHDLIDKTPALIHTVSGFNRHQQAAIRQCVETMSTGMLEFQEIKNPYGLETLSAMNQYCYYVAGVVGEMLTRLFCDYSKQIAKTQEKLFRLSVSFGQGLQMVNILKDLWEDRARGACWLPRDVFHNAGFDLDHLSAGDYRPAFGKGLADLIAIAHGHLKNALSYTLLIPRHETGIRRFCLWALGMAIFTLHNINKNRRYTKGQEVKISKATARNIIFVSNAALRSNVLLKIFFKTATRGLPMSYASSN